MLFIITRVSRSDILSLKTHSRAFDSEFGANYSADSSASRSFQYLWTDFNIYNFYIRMFQNDCYDFCL